MSVNLKGVFSAYIVILIIFKERPKKPAILAASSDFLELFNIQKVLKLVFIKKVSNVPVYIINTIHIYYIPTCSTPFRIKF